MELFNISSLLGGSVHYYPVEESVTEALAATPTGICQHKIRKYYCYTVRVVLFFHAFEVN